MPLGANKVALYGASADTGSAVLLSTATASSDASIEFTLPTAYKQVVFSWYSILPATDDDDFKMNVSSDGGSTWVTKRHRFLPRTTRKPTTTLFFNMREATIWRNRPPIKLSVEMLVQQATRVVLARCNCIRPQAPLMSNIGHRVHRVTVVVGRPALGIISEVDTQIPPRR